MHELSDQDAFCIGVEPGDENAHGGHGESEGQEKWEPVCTVGRSGSEVIDHRQVPQAPEQSEQDTRAERIVLRRHFGKRECSPADLFQESSGDAEQDPH